MPTTSITIHRKNRVVATLTFTYDNDVYHGKTVISGPDAGAVRKLLRRPMLLYIPDMGGAGAGRTPKPRAWPWLHAAVHYIMRGENAFADRYEVKDPPPKTLFRKIPPPPFGATP